MNNDLIMKLIMCDNRAAIEDLFSIYGIEEMSERLEILQQVLKCVFYSPCFNLLDKYERTIHELLGANKLYKLTNLDALYAKDLCSGHECCPV